MMIIHKTEGLPHNLWTLDGAMPPLDGMPWYQGLQVPKLKLVIDLNTMPEAPGVP